MLIVDPQLGNYGPQYQAAGPAQGLIDPNLNMNQHPGSVDMMGQPMMGGLDPVRRMPQRGMSMDVGMPRYNPAIPPNVDYAMYPGMSNMGVQHMGAQVHNNLAMGGALLPARDFRHPRALHPSRHLHPSMLDYDDSDEFDLGPGRMPLMRRATMAGPMISPPFHGPLVHPAGAVVDSYQFQRPYCYESGYRPGGPVYPLMGNDLGVLRNLLTAGIKTTDMKPYIDILAQRSPYEIEALRYNFRAMTGGMELSLAINTVLDATSQKQSVKYAFTGLVLGPALFDLWLLQQVLP